MKFLPLALLLLTPLLSFAQEEKTDPAEATEASPKAEKIDENRYRIGQVTLNKKTREISFPAVINQREGLLEYMIVHENGKIHESVFRTAVSPTNINLAFTLLRYKPSKELYRIPREVGILTSEFYKVPEEISLASRVEIFVEVKKNGETKRYPVREWVRHEPTAKTMAPSYWVYGGSEFYDGKFVPETTGDIAAIFITNSSLVNYSGDDNLNDEVWTCFTSRIPPLDTEVTLIFAPFPN